MSLAPFVRIVAQGKGRARAMTEDEAEAAMAEILTGDPAPEAVGALLMVLRLRGETVDEIAGFVKALRATLGRWNRLGAALDWPSYASWRTRGAPWYLLSARLVAEAGHPVLLHGRNATESHLRSHLAAMGAQVVETPEDARDALAGGLAYLPVEAMSPEAARILNLRADLGLRSCINTCLRMANPGGATASVQGVFHPGYRPLQADVAERLGDPATMILKGGGGEFERTPFKAVALFGQRDGRPFPAAPPQIEAARRLGDLELPDSAPIDLWDGRLSDPAAEATVIGTAALALLTLGTVPDLPTAELEARQLWATRHARSAAA
ncbi:MAG: glycosyl transferase family protein [Pseudomonadota bacterium]